MISLPRGVRLFLILLPVSLAVPAFAGETVERSLELEGRVADGAVVVFENLLGSITVRGTADADRVRVEARVVAEGESKELARGLADTIGLERRDRDGEAVFHVTYPVERHTGFRIPRAEADGLMAKWVMPLVKKSSVATRYDDHTIEVGQVKGAAGLVVHLVVHLPFERSLRFSQLVGSLHCVGYRGTVYAENVEGEVLFEQVYGDLTARTSGAQVTVRTFRGGDLEVHTGAGTVEVVDVQARAARLDSRAGLIHASGVVADSIDIDSVQGDVHLEGVEPVSLDVRAGSGWVDISTLLTKTRQASIRSTSGDVVLRMGKLPGFDLEAESETGSVKVAGLGRVEILEQDNGVARLRRGGGGADLRVASDSGKVSVRPF